MSTKGVTYIKINRIDNEGNDNTLTLQGLTDIRIKYSDIGVKDYPVYTITEYPDYYLYQLYTTDITSSIDNNILDYKCEASTASISVGGYGDFPPILPIPLTETTDNLSYYLTNKYTLQNTPNINLIISASGTSSAYVLAYLMKNSQVLDQTVSSLSGGPFSLSYEGNFQTEDEIYISYNSIGSNTLTNVNFIVTQSISPTSSLNQVVLEPYVTENFEFSDCNVLYGNVDSYPFNPLYMDVDYSTNGMIAINTNQIINGDATRSTVKPYYYSLRRHIRPRYNGSENIDKGTFEFDTVSTISNTYLISNYDSDGNPNILPSNNVNVGDNIIIYQNNILKGIATIIDKSDFGIKVASNNYNTPQPFIVNKITLDNILSGIAYLTPNTYENSNVFPLDTFNSDIFEYRYGTTTFPEIPNAGMLVMGNILEVADQNNVNILQQGSQYFEAYNKIINDTFTPNIILSDIRQYGDGKQVLLNNLQVITSNFGTPKSPQNAGDIVEYWIPTTNLPSSGYASTADDDTIVLLSDIFSIELNELNQYITGSVVNRENIGNYISSSLQNGDRWFATFYENLPNPLDQTSLTPLNVFNNPFAYPISDPYQTLLGNRGVVEIISSSIIAGNARLLYTPRSSFGDLSIGGNNQKGLIIWKATTPSPKQGKYVIVSKPNVNELGPGAIVLPDSNDAINNYYNEITTTYGTNTKPPTNQSSKGPSPGSSGLSR